MLRRSRQPIVWPTLLYMGRRRLGERTIRHGCSWPVTLPPCLVGSFFGTPERGRNGCAGVEALGCEPVYAFQFALLASGAWEKSASGPSSRLSCSCGCASAAS